MCVKYLLCKEQASPTPCPEATGQLPDPSLGRKPPYTYKKGAVQWTVVHELQFVPSKETCFAYKYQVYGMYEEISAHRTQFMHITVLFYTEACTHLTVWMPALYGILDRNATEYSGTVMSKAADIAQAVNNLRLKIMKAPRLTVSTEYCKTQELLRAITVVRDCNWRNCSIHRQIYTSLINPHNKVCVYCTLQKATVLE